MGNVTRIIDAIGQGDKSVSADLLPLVYNELRQLAARRLAHEAPGQTIQATELVHEVYLRLAGSEHQTWEGRRHFFGAAAEAMRRILIDRARRKGRLKHGGGWERVNLMEVELPAFLPSDDLLAIDHALEELAAVDPQAAELVKLRYFAGLTQAQIATAFGVSRRTADNIWAFAKAWMYRALRPQNKGSA